MSASKKIIVLLTAVLAFGVMLGTVNQKTAEASGRFPSEMVRRGTWRDCQTRSLSGCGTQGWLANGTHVKMHCWVDASWAGSGQRRSNRWFYVTSETGVRGYVFSSNVRVITETCGCRV